MAAPVSRGVYHLIRLHLRQIFDNLQGDSVGKEIHEQEGRRSVRSARQNGECSSCAVRRPPSKGNRWPIIKSFGTFIPGFKWSRLRLDL
jgi:hypothetical protein